MCMGWKMLAWQAKAPSGPAQPGLKPTQSSPTPPSPTRPAARKQCHIWQWHCCCAVLVLGKFHNWILIARFYSCTLDFSILRRWQLQDNKNSAFVTYTVILMTIWNAGIQKLGGCAPFGEGEMGSHLTPCGQGQGLPACQVSSWSIQPFGDSTPMLQPDKTDRQTDRTGQTDRQRSDSIGRTI